MIFECIEGNPFTIDGTPILRNLQINFAGNRQLRLKCELIDGDRVEPIDIVIYNYSDINITPLTASAFATVRNMAKNQNIQVKILFDLLRHTCKIEAGVDGRPINRNVSTPEDILGVLRDILGLRPSINSSIIKGGYENDKITTCRKKESF